MESSKVSLKLLVHKSSRKILFGQADKNFMDLLFSILALPVATIFNLVSTESTVGPLRNLYHSVHNLNTDYFEEKCKKNINFLLKPKVDIASISELLPIESSLSQRCYKCYSSSCQFYYETEVGRQCLGCYGMMNKELRLHSSSLKDALMRESMMSDSCIGCVKDKISFMVMDDLTIKPMSAMSTISMLAEFGVDDATLVEEKVVFLDAKQCLDLLRASISSSSTVLSDAFLCNLHFQDSTKTDEEKKMQLLRLKEMARAFRDEHDL